MTENALPLMVYALLLAVALLLPYTARHPQSPHESEPRWLAILLTGGALILTLLRGGLLVEGAVLLVVSSLGAGLRSLAGAAAAALLLAASTWWLLFTDIPPAQHLIAAAACLGLGLLVRQCRFEASGTEQPVAMSRRSLATPLALFAAGIAAGLLTGAVNDKASAIMAWHHWGVYISPALSLLAGGVPFRDFPLQYGMGPTVLFAATCGIGNCWTGLYAATIVTNALYLAVFGWIVMLLTRHMDRASRLLALAALACATLLWSGLPFNWGSAIMTPSVGGMRFLPLVMLLALILTIEARQLPEVGLPADLPRAHFLTGCALWLLGLAWSPEAAFFATLLWWPWLALRRADGAVTASARWLALLRGGMIGISAVLAGYAVLAVLFRAMFGDWVSLSDFLLYLSNPPGRLPVFALGAIWFAAAVLLLGFVALTRAEQGSARRSIYACLLTALAAASYYLSRSHDNNVLNLLPFVILLLLAARTALPGQFSGGFLRAALAGIVALTTSIHFHAWTVLPGSPSLAGLQLGPSALVSRFSPKPGPIESLEKGEATAALADLRSRTSEAITLVDWLMIMPDAAPAKSWTVVNNSPNFIPLPHAVTRRYVQQGAKLFQRSGWLLVANENAAEWLGLFAAAYNVSETRSYRGYTAYRMVPRRAPFTIAPI